MANKMNITINFDMDGTIADLYGVENWLEKLIAEEVKKSSASKGTDGFVAADITTVTMKTRTISAPRATRPAITPLARVPVCRI